MAIASTFKIEIEDASLVWQDVTSSVVTSTDGTSSESQIIPTININFGIDADSVLQYLDATINPTRARIRVTEATTTTYYLMENGSGTVSNDNPYPSTSGRAFAGRIVDFPVANYTNITDLKMSAICQQICTENISNQSGTSIAVSWEATEDPTVPGKRIELTRADRLSSIRDIAASCGAGVRVSLDGLSFEVFDIPTKALTDSASFDFDNALSLSYRDERIDKPLNAIRIKGAAFDYSVGLLPRLNVWIAPDTIPADGGVSTAVAAAQVFDSSGVPVKHVFVDQEPIDADSFTIIPVSGCFSVTGVWLNDGSQAVPVLGARIDYTTFNASTITVPTQATDLFIVSYTQAEEVSWDIEDYADKVTGEAQDTTGTLSVSTTNPLGQVIGVYLSTDTRRIGTNFYTGGSFTQNTTVITLGISPGATGVSVLIDYVKYNATPLTGVNISPSSSLCNAAGVAESTVGSGTAIGVGMVVAESLGQQGFAQLSLTGEDVASLELTADPALIRRNVEDETVITPYVGEISTVTTVGGLSYILVDNPVYSATSVVVAGYPLARVFNWENDGANYKIYLTGAAIPNGTASTVTYDGFEEITEEEKTSTITATVLGSDGLAVTDGTVVYFEFANLFTRGCTLSSETDTTVDGVASVTLTSGERAGTVYVRAIVGGYKAKIEVTVTDKDLTSGIGRIYGESGGWSWEDCNSYEEGSKLRTDCENNEAIERAEGPSGSGGTDETCIKVPNDTDVGDGAIQGSRRIVGCEGQPLPGLEVTMVATGQIMETDEDGRFFFSTGSEGSNAILVNGKEYSFNISPRNSDGRGGYKIVCRDKDGNLTYEGDTV